MRKQLLTGIILVLVAMGSTSAAEIKSSVERKSLSAKKQTPLNLYLTPSDAHAALNSNPDIIFLDVRDPIEISFVGHAQGVDAIVPLAIASHKYDAKGGRYALNANKNFLQDAEKAIAGENGDKTTTIFVMCRSGSRSAVAARLLIKAGYTNVWNLVEGFEGDADKKTGARTVNGWRNAGLPWQYKITEDIAWKGQIN